MASSVKSFQFFQKFNRDIGIYQSDPKHPSINWRKIIILGGNILYGLPMAAYAVFEAESMFEYGMGFFQTISTINSIAVYLLFIWQLDETLAFIKTCEMFIEESK